MELYLILIQHVAYIVDHSPLFALHLVILILPFIFERLTAMAHDISDDVAFEAVSRSGFGED